MDLGVPIPTIDSAVTMRQISARKTERVAANAKMPIFGMFLYLTGKVLKIILKFI
jgi:6-phosphogluconate dehydrogenase